MSRAVTLTRGNVAIVDDDDYVRIMRYNWCTRRNSGGRLYAYRNTVVNGVHRQQPLASFILGTPHGVIADHIDGDSLNNRRSNLRAATVSQNAQNKRPARTGTSIYKGVAWSRDARKWRASIHANNKYVHLGYHTNEIDAAKAYDTKARELFGEFARCNLPL